MCADKDELDLQALLEGESLARLPVIASKEAREFLRGISVRHDRDRITEAILLGIPRSEHSAQAEMLDMQEARGSSPLPPTSHEFVFKWAP